MARAAARIYVPLDAAFFDDDKVLKAGEKAAYLYLNVLTKCRSLDSDGVISRQQIARLGVPGWAARLTKCVESGLLEELPLNRDLYSVPSWLDWNESKEARGARLESDRRRKREYLESKQHRGES